MYNSSEPDSAVALAVACSLFEQPTQTSSRPLLLVLCPTHDKRHLDRRRRTLPPQWRDPCISSLLLLLHLPFLNQPQKLGCPIHVAASRDIGGNVHPHPASSCFCRWLFFVSVVAFVCQFYVVILSAAKNPRISEGSVATRVPFFFHHPNTVISTGAAHGFIVSSGAEKPASLPKPPPNPNRRLCLCSLLPHPVFLVNPPNTLNPCPQTRSTWRTSFTQPAKLVKESKKAPATSRGFPV